MNWPSCDPSRTLRPFSLEPADYSRPASSLRRGHAGVTGRIGARALTGKTSDCRMGAPRALRNDPLARVVVAIEGCDDLVRGRAVLDPVRERRDNVVPGVPARRGQSEDAADG